MNKTKIYSPNQVFIISFFGGPFAAVYAIWKNFDSLHDSADMRKTLIWGAIFSASVLVILSLLPDNFPNYAIPAAYAVVARIIAEKHQMSKQAILQSSDYEIQSTWNVVAVIVGLLLAFVGVAFAWILILGQFGINII